MRSGAPRLIFLAAFVLNVLLWSQSRYAHIPRSQTVSLSKRSLRPESGVLSGLVSGFQEDECHPVTLPLSEQCSNAVNSCPEPHTVFSIPYVQHYFCAKPSVRPLLFTGYVLWGLFIFSTLGISASDFFCPNLATLAQILGLDENVAGVTFLAFGNGSPDVFSTFSAMRTDSGGLALGELLGAASFVTSVVVGSMCIIKPFKVDRGPFLRDVGFFTVAVIVILFVLWDSELESWEAMSLVGLYFVYVTVVVLGSWWERRRERRRRMAEMMRDEYREEDIPQSNEPYRDDPSITPAPSQTLGMPTTRSRALSTPGPPRLGIELPARPHTRESSPHSSHASTPQVNHMPSFSLIGALEFRRVVSSLQEQAAGSRLSLFDSPSTPYPGGHYHRRVRTSSSRSRTPIHIDENRDPWDAALGVPLEQRSPQRSPPLEPTDVETGAPIADIPSITTTPPTPALTDTDDSQQFVLPPTRRQRLFHVLGHIFHVLFPTLHSFKSKSFLGMVAAIFATPAVLALTLTLPVVVTDHDAVGSPKETKENVARLVDFEEEGRERALVAEDVVENDLHGLQFNKWLMAVQCALGPLFCVAILFDGARHESWLLLATGIAGTTVGVLVAVFSGPGETKSGRLARCTMGFIVAVVWIMAIADEVVEVLQTFGLIFGLSDAIIGLTVFAMGNSLADLVANMSVAVFAPIMGFSACFGGPMLNILLGIGITGTYITRQTGEVYPLEFSTTLFMTGIGLLAILLVTLVFVPWNGYFLPRMWGVALIVAYVALMAANIVVEVKTHTSAS